MFPIDSGLAEYLESGVIAALGTGSRDGWGQITWAWGTRVVDPAGEIEVFVDAVPGEPALRNLEENPKVAIVYSDPVSYRSVQLKGKFLSIGDPEGEDLDQVQRQRDAVLASASLVGDPPAVIRALWTSEVRKLRISVESAFNQTPGPNAGAPL